MHAVASAVLVLVAVLMIFGVIFFGLRRTGGQRGRVLFAADVRRRWGANDLESGFAAVSAFTGVTVAVASLTIARWAGASESTSTTIGLAVGVLYAVLVIARSKSGGSGRIVQVIRGVVEGVVGLFAIVPASIRYFQVAIGCDGSGTPIWFSLSVYGLLLAACAWAVVSGTSHAIARGESPASGLSVFLAVFAACEIATFFMSPFGLSLLQLPVLGWLTAYAGVLVLLIGCLLAPELVILAGGVVIAVSVAIVDAGYGQACEARAPGGLAVLLTYGAGFVVTWLLVKVVLLDAILHVPDRK